MTIPLQKGILYGPVASRRFGLSLGVNLLPATAKVCNLDCVYCQYSNRFSPGARFPSHWQVERECDAYLARAAAAGRVFDWIMFSGNGESTLHPRFAAAVDGVLRARDRHFPCMRVGILSNSTTCGRPEVARVLGRLDARFMKLDAGYAKAFGDVNRPAGDKDWKRVLDGLKKLRGVVLQALFFEGPGRNTDENNIERWICAVQYVGPDAVDVYTVDRPPSEQWVRPASQKTLKAIAQRVTAETGITANVH